MKRILAALLLAFCGMALHAQATFTPSAMTAMCFSSTLAKWVPMAALASGTAATYTPQSVALYGNNGASYYPLQCDASGNLTLGPASYWSPSGVSASTWAFTQNKEVYTAYDVPSAVIANSVCVRPTTADNTATNNYSFALYNSSGAKVLDTGAVHGSTFASATSPVCTALATAATIPAGRYYASFTTNCSASCAVLASGAITYLAPLVNSQGAATTGGAANTTITVPADSFSNVAVSAWVELHK